MRLRSPFMLSMKLRQPPRIASIVSDPPPASAAPPIEAGSAWADVRPSPADVETAGSVAIGVGLDRAATAPTVPVSPAIRLPLPFGVSAGPAVPPSGELVRAAT